MYRNLLVATDGSKLSDKALAHGISLAQAVGASLTAFYAAPEYPMPAYADGVVYEPVSMLLALWKVPSPLPNSTFTAEPCTVTRSRLSSPSKSPAASEDG